MVSPNKRAADSIEDGDVTTPKKEKKTPKKTPKVVKLEPGTPKSLAVLKSPVHQTSPLIATTSAKKIKKTPVKPKAVETPKNSNTPQAGKLSQPSPVQTRSARKKKAEINAMIGTPSSKGVTPTKIVKGTNLNSKTTPKTQKSTPNPKGKKINKKEEFKLELDEDEEMDSDDLDSDDNMGGIDNDSDDIASDDETIDEEHVERLKAELQSIINKPVSSKSILKTAKTPIKVGKTELTKTPPPAQKDKKVVETSLTPPKLVAKEGNVEEKSSTEVVEKTPVTKKNARRSIKAVDAEATEKNVPENVIKSPQAQKTPNKKAKALANASPVVEKSSANEAHIPAKTQVNEETASAKTPTKEVIPVKTPSKEKTPAPVKTPAKLEVSASVKTPVKPKEVATPVKTPAKPEEVAAAVKTPAKPKEVAAAAVKTPAKPKEVATPVKTPAKPKEVAAAAVKTPAKPKEVATPVKTPAKPKEVVAAAVKTPAKPKEVAAAVKTPVMPKEVAAAVKTPAMPKEVAAAVKTLTEEKEASAENTQGDAKKAKKSIKKGIKSVQSKENQVPTTESETSDNVDEVPAKEITTEDSEIDVKAAKALAKKLKWAQKKAQRKEMKAANAENEASVKELSDENTQVGPKKAEKLELVKKGIKCVESKENQVPMTESKTLENVDEVAAKEITTENSAIDVKAAKALAKKLKWAQKKAQRKELQAVDSNGVTTNKNAGVNSSIVHDMIKHLGSKQIGLVHRSPQKKHVAAAIAEERCVEVRQKLVSIGKTNEEIDRELPRIMLAIEKRVKVTRCLRCRKMGHLQRDCPVSKTRPANKCYKCGNTTHNVKDCSIKEDVFTYADCFICHQTGHLSRTCPKNPKGMYPHGGGCFKCGDKTHLGKFCSGAKQSQQDEAPEMIHKKAVVGVLDSKQSADADITDTVVEKTPIKALKKGNKKRVVKF